LRGVWVQKRRMVKLRGMRRFEDTYEENAFPDCTDIVLVRYPGSRMNTPY
jgi:hypothetical protein